jgi:hypothetical protein
MSNETSSNLTPEQMAARIAELEGRLAYIRTCLEVSAGDCSVPEMCQ